MNYKPAYYLYWPAERRPDALSINVGYITKTLEVYGRNDSGPEIVHKTFRLPYEKEWAGISMEHLILSYSWFVTFTLSNANWSLIYKTGQHFECKFIVKKKPGQHKSIQVCLHFNWCAPAGKIENMHWQCRSPKGTLHCINTYL